MWIVKIFSIILICRVVQGRPNHEKASNYVRNILEDFNLKDSATHDVVLLRLSVYKHLKRQVDEIYEAMNNSIPKENPVMKPHQSDMSKVIGIRKAAVIVIVSDVADALTLVKELKRAQGSQYWSNKSKFIIVSMHFGRSHTRQMASFLFSAGCLNAIMIGTNGVEFDVSSYNPFKKGAKMFYLVDTESKSVDVAFPDKLKDMKGYAYKVMSTIEYPVTVFKNDKAVGTGIEFIRTVSKKQNAKYDFKPIDYKDSKSAISKFLVTGEADMSLNTGMKVQTNPPNLIKYVNTFDTNGFCVLVPNPARKSFFIQIVTPFDPWVWVLISVTVVCLVVVWHFLNKYSPIPNSNSGWFMLFAFVAFFLGQGVEFCKRRKMQEVLLQLMILMTFILGNAYQSILISLLSESRYANKITTIQGLIDSNYTFVVDPVFDDMLKSSDQYQKLGEKMSVITTDDFKSFAKLSAAKSGFILSCAQVEALYKDTGKLFDTGNQKAIDFYYRVPEKFYSFYKVFPTAPYSPFTDRLQSFSLRIHESGIKQQWMTSLSFEDMEAVKKREFIANEEYLLNFKDLEGAFYIVGIGLLAALLAFLLEISVHYWLQRRKNRVTPCRFIEVEPNVFEMV